MVEFVRHGYVSMLEALNYLGRERFPKEWTGEEHKARTGLMSVEEASMPGTGASGGGMRPGGVIIAERRSNAPAAKVAWTATGKSVRNDPSNPTYQAEHRAAQRFEIVSHQLRALLEAGKCQAVILDPWSGVLHPAPARMWRQNGADRIIKSGRAQIPPSGNIGPLFVEAFIAAQAPSRPFSPSKIEEAIAYLTKKTAAENLTRAQQEDLVRKQYSEYRITHRQLMKIFQSVPAQKGRPTKSNKKD